MSAQPSPEFSIKLSIAEVPSHGVELSFDAREAERAALARRLDLVELKAFRGSVHVKPWRKVGFTVEGRFEADVVQSCVITLEPVPAHLSQRFVVHYLPEEMLGGAVVPGSEREIVIDPESDEPPEALEGGRLDVGEAVAEQLALALDPYPRKPGVTFEAPDSDEGDARVKPANPFAALEKLKKKD